MRPIRLAQILAIPLSEFGLARGRSGFRAFIVRGRNTFTVTVLPTVFQGPRTRKLVWVLRPSCCRRFRVTFVLIRVTKFWGSMPQLTLTVANRLTSVSRPVRSVRRVPRGLPTLDGDPFRGRGNLNLVFLIKDHVIVSV